jgi:hypothetical protein
LLFVLWFYFTRDPAAHRSCHRFPCSGARAQDASTGAIRGVVLDPEGRPVPAATIAVVRASIGAQHSALSDEDGGFVVKLLPPGDYSARAEIKGMSPQVTPQIHVDVGGVIDLQFSAGLRSLTRSLMLLTTDKMHSWLAVP